MQVTVTDTTVTVVAAWGDWTDEQWNECMKAHGVYDLPMAYIDYTTDGDTERWLMFRDMTQTKMEVADERAC